MTSAPSMPPSAPAPDSDPASTPAARRRARLLAVQALFQQDFRAQTADRAIAEFLSHHLKAEGAALKSVDMVDDAGSIPFAQELFTHIVKSVADRQVDIEPMLIAVLPTDWPLHRLDPALLAALRAGVAEILANPDVASPVIINDYVEIGHAFFSGKEPGLINAVLDRIAKDVRGHEPRA